jgi:hypothetical protein
MVWLTKSKISEDRLEELKTVLKTGKFLVDPTFKWKIENLTLTIESPDRNTAHRRGMWLIHKFDSRMRYTVTETKTR